MELNLEYARKNEGIFYGDGVALLAEWVAKAAKPYRTAQKRAFAAHKAVRKFADETGCNPDIECSIRRSDGGWRVSFEAGPYQWGIVASEALCQVGVFAEPHYSFDLIFYDE
jgi:hypothetical protein